MKKSIKQLIVGLSVAVMAFTGLAAFSPAGSSSVLGTQKAAASGCSTYNYYQVMWSSVAVRANPDRTSQIRATYSYGQTALGPHSKVMQNRVVGADGASYTYVYPGGWSPTDALLLYFCS